MADSESKVYLSEDSDPEMEQAYEKARSTFRYFWREVAWERRRIVPALDMACVKAPFSDGVKRKPAPGTPGVEHMWMAEVDFDGKVVSGVLLNSPNWLTSIKEGDSAQIRLDQISDWMYAIEGNVFGAYTVNLLRSRMGRGERQQHDNAWGMNFGDSKKIRITPEPEKGGGFLKSLFSKPQPPSAEHPMSAGMAESLKTQLNKDRSLVSQTDDQGWTLLHQEALAGSSATVKVLLDAGADRNAKTKNGMTAADLARSLGWDEVVALVSKR